MKISLASATMLALASTSATLGVSNISPSHQSSWSENAGWMNWRQSGSPISTQGVVIDTGYLTGYIWAENLGYICVGNAPQNASHYTNLSGQDHGVNFAPDGTLSGFAWSENVGWINFSGGAQATPSNPARIDFVANRFRGMAWSENIGWINLDDEAHFVAPRSCAGDANGDGKRDGNDLSILLHQFGTPLEPWTDADFNGDGKVNNHDLSVLLANFGQPC